MAWNPIYRVVARSAYTRTLWYADIEKEDYAGTVQELNGSAQPFKLSYSDNDEDKITAIRGSALTISFVSASFMLEWIMDDNDTKYRVTLRDEVRVQWRGFISTDDCSEAYTSGVRTFTLTATDGLGSLKDQRWERLSGLQVYGKMPLLDIIRDCLNKTITELPIHVSCKLYETSMVEDESQNPFTQCQLHSKLLFLTDSGPSNAYEVLEMIMDAFDCTIFQQFGQWHVIRMVDRLNALPVFSSIYSWPDLTNLTIQQPWDVARFSEINPINASHLLAFIKPTSFSKIQHDYIIPDIPENDQLTDGGLISEAPGERRYFINFWTYQSGSVTAPTDTAPGYAYRKEVDDVEGNLSESYIVLPDNGTNDERLRPADGVWVEAGDTVSFSAETRLDADLSGAGSGIAARIVLYGESGQKYTWDQGGGAWFPTLTSQIGQSSFTRGWNAGDDLTTWVGFSVYYTNLSGREVPTTAPFPEGGILELWLQEWSTGVRETWFRKVSIEIFLFQNGVTENFKGESSKSDNNLSSKKSTEKTIMLGDAPKRVIASALWRLTNENELTTGWKRLGELTNDRLINLNSQDLQKASSRVFKRLDGDFRGVTFDEGKLIGPGNFFIIDNLVWVATNIELDLHNETLSVTLQEFQDENKPIADIDTEFKYLFDERS